MSPYPFAKMPTLVEFIQRVGDQFGVRVVKGNSTISGPHRTDNLSYFEREHEGKVYRVPVPVWSPDSIIHPTKLRQLCYRLRIPLDEFGFVLDKERGYVKVD